MCLLLDLIIPQNEKLVKLYKVFYKIDNVQLLYNFRNCEITSKKYSNNNSLRIIYASRICEYKGVVDLLEVVSKLNSGGKSIILDIYGEKQLDEFEEQKFNSYISKNISYKGVIPFEKMIDTIKNYDLFCLPTRYHGEGTSGALIESFISSYSQAKLLVEDGVTGFIFNIGDIDDLEKKLVYLYENKELLKDVGEAAQNMSQKYLFSFNKKTFLSCILGDEKWKYY